MGLWNRSRASRVAVAFLFGIGASTAADAGVLSSQKPINCSSTPFPVTPVNADGYGVFGEITVNAVFADGKVQSVELVSGEPALLKTTEAALLRYNCEKTEAPRTLTMTFEFENSYAKRPPRFPVFDSRNTAIGSNSLVRGYFPTRVDAVLNVSEMESGRFTPLRLLEDAKPVSPSRNPRNRGDWTVTLVFLVETDGKPSNITILSNAPPAVRDAARTALERSRFAPATYGDTPVPTASTKKYQFLID